MAHTPGPWVWGFMHNDWSDGDVFVCASPARGGICQITNKLGGLKQTADTDRTIADQEANANLISAAPDLLDALKRMVEKFGWTVMLGESGSDALKAASDAINKAEGRAS